MPVFLFFNHEELSVFCSSYNTCRVYILSRLQVMELTDTSREAQERQAVLLRKLEAEKKKRSLIVPTNPAEVRTSFPFIVITYIHQAS